MLLLDANAAASCVIYRGDRIVQIVFRGLGFNLGVEQINTGQCHCEEGR